MGLFSHVHCIVHMVARGYGVVTYVVVTHGVVVCAPPKTPQLTQGCWASAMASCPQAGILGERAACLV